MTSGCERNQWTSPFHGGGAEVTTPSCDLRPDLMETEARGGYHSAGDIDDVATISIRICGGS